LSGDFKRRKKTRNAEDELPLSVYEAHSAILHYRADTQPITSRWEVMPDSLPRRILGTKSGNWHGHLLGLIPCWNCLARRKWNKKALKIAMY